MKTFSTSGTGSQQTLSEIETDKIPVYDSKADAESDLANLEAGQLGLTKDTGSELSAPTDTVQSGNMHAVTSNAVAKSQKISTTTETITLPYTATQRCIVYINGNPSTTNPAYASFSINNTIQINISSSNGLQQGATCILEEGDILTQISKSNFSIDISMRKIGV
jgi:hypothetical protein